MVFPMPRRKHISGSKPLKTENLLRDPLTAWLSTASIFSPKRSQAPRETERTKTGGLKMMKRIAVWFIETCLEVLLLGLVLTLLLGYDQHAFLKDVLIY